MSKMGVHSSELHRMRSRRAPIKSTFALKHPRRSHDRNKIFDWIVAYKTDNDGNSPTFSEIGVAFKINSKSVIKRIVEDLEDAGRIRLESNRVRSIHVIGGQWNFDHTASKAE
jgi:SOS-response transcriptional repressor LexA